MSFAIEPGAHQTRRRRRRWPWIVLGILVVLIAFAIDLVWAGSHAYTDFRQARDSLNAGGDELLSGDLDGARDSFSAAHSVGTGATDALGHPAVTLVGWLPWFRDEVDAARRGADATVLAAEGGGGYANAAIAAGWDGKTVPGFAPGGKVDTGALQRAAPDIQKAADLLEQADDELVPVDPSTLFSPLAGPMRDAKDEIHQRAEQARTAALLASVLPPILGADGDRTYLLVTLSQSDPRQAGGYPGVFGLLHADGKRIRLTNLAATSTIPRATPPVPGPPEAKKVWGWTGI